VNDSNVFLCKTMIQIFIEA